ncbi:relA-associated inhibitor [Pristis pectinata]|uniref:relA-associated inhibitor n=1 Tax=Pristis pectinata TaxID=685728 RepID=UPI00223D7507|nr:relA-associated inhibitor [Pristis pectinata]
MADDQLKFSPTSLGNIFSPVLESQTNLLLQSGQQKVNDAALELDKLSQELESMWSIQGSSMSHQPVQTNGKDVPVTTANPFGTSISNKLEPQSKDDRPWPVTDLTRSTSTQPSQTYTPLTSECVSSPYGFVPLIFPPKDQRSQSNRAPSPRLTSGPLIPYSQPDYRSQSGRAPSPRSTSGTLTPHSQPDQRSQSDQAPSPRLTSGPLIPYSKPDQRSQSDRAPSPRLMSGPLIPYSQPEYRSQLDRAPSPRPMSGTLTPHSQPNQRSQSDRAPSPRPMSGPMTPYSQPDQHRQSDRAPSPRGFNPLTSFEKSEFPPYHTQSPLRESPSLSSSAVDRMISQSPSLSSPSPLPFSGPGCLPDLFRGAGPRENIPPLYATASFGPERSKLTLAAEDASLTPRPKPEFTPELGAFNAYPGDTSKQKKPASVWAEADLDIAYEKKSSKTPSHENKWDSNWNTVKQEGGWRQTDLDLEVPSNKLTRGRTSANAIQLYGTLPKSTQAPSASPWHVHATLPRQRRPGSPWGGPSLPSPIVGWATVPPGGPRTSAIKERRNVLPLSVFIRPGMVSNRGQGLGRDKPQLGTPASSTLWSPPQPRPGQEASSLAETGEVEPEIAGILPPGEVEGVPPRPLSPTRLQPVSLPNTEDIQDKEELLKLRASIPRALKKRTSIDQPPEERLPLEHHTRRYQQLTSFFRQGSQEAAEDPAQTSPAFDPEHGPIPASTVTVSPTASPVKRSILKKEGRSGTSKKMKARLSPLVVLLDAALLGELDVVQQVVHQIDDPSQSNDEGITALHNAVCGGHYDVVEFLVNFGVNVNVSDSHGWTPLHCAASCNDLPICTLLVEERSRHLLDDAHDGATAAEKCDPYLDGYEECARFLFSAEQQAGMVNSAVLYALWDYEAENSDELSFREGEAITILQRGDKEESHWWWASLYGREGYIPYNLLGLFPRVKPAV